jgi:hypothetical protein
MPLLLPRRGEPDGEPVTPASEPDSAPRFEAKIAPARQERDDLLAFPARKGRFSGPRERHRALQDRFSRQLGRRALENRRRGDYHVSPKRERGANVPLERVVDLLAAAREDFDAACERLGVLALKYEFTAQTVARERQVTVRAVPAPREAAALEKRENLAAGDGKQRPDDAVGADLAGTGEAREAPLALPGEKVRLEPVVSLMGRRDATGARLLRHLEEGFVADAPRPGLGGKAEKARLPASVPPAVEEGKPEPPRVLPDELEVAVGVPAAPAMVDVRDEKRPAGFPRGLSRRVEQRHRVRPAGDGEEDRPATGHESPVGGFPQGISDRVHSSCYDAGREIRRRVPDYFGATAFDVIANFHCVRGEVR